MSSAALYWLILLCYISVLTNCVGPYQTAPGGAVRSWHTLLDQEASNIVSRRQNHTTFVVIDASWGNIDMDVDNGRLYCTCLLFHFSFLSIWFIVCITVENYIMTFHQSRAVTYCSVIRAKIAVTATVVCAVLMYMGQFWIATVVDFGDGMVFCTEAEEYRYLNRIYFFYDSIVTLIIPSMVTTALILVIVVRNMCIHRSLANKKLSKKQKALLRITRVLLAISLTFVILSAPTHANKLRHLIIVEVFGQQSYSLKDRVLQHFFQILYYLSFSLNFVYYLIWSINFRKEFKRLFCFKTRPRRMRRLELMAGNGHIVGKGAINHTQRITLL